MRRIAIMNQKGGVGKTTTTTNLAAALALKGQRVLLIDLDPQAHLTIHYGVEPADVEVGAYELLVQSALVETAIRTIRKNVSLIAAHTDLVAAESELVSIVGREMILRDALAKVDDDFDFMLIDCPPSLGLLTLNALAAAEEVCIPLQAHFLALQGLAKLLDTVSLVQARINPALRVGGVLLCMFEAGTRLAVEVVEDLTSFLAEAKGRQLPWSEACLFNTRIRRNIKLAECPSYGQTIFDYEPRCRGAEDYLSLAAEVLGGIQENEIAEPVEAVGLVTVGKSPATATPSPQAALVADTQKSTAVSPPGPAVAKKPSKKPATKKAQKPRAKTPKKEPAKAKVPIADEAPASRNVEPDTPAQEPSMTNVA